MDPNTPTPATPQPSDGLIMPDQPQVTAEPTPIPVTTSVPAPAPEPVPTPAPVPAPAPEPVPAAAIPVTVTSAVPAVPEAPVVPEAAPVPEPEPDPLFEEVTEPDPLEVVPEPVAPTPAPPVTDQAMQQLDDGAQPVVAAATGQTVVASTSKPHKSRRKTMLILIVGLLVAGAVGFGAYKLLVKPNVSETAAPSDVVAVDKLSPELLTQATDKAELSAGSQTNAGNLVFSGKVPDNAPVGVGLQIEIQPLGTDFTGTPTEDAVAVPDSTDPLKLTVANYAAGSYHWRGRLSDGTSNGPWVAYNTGDDAGKTADFTIDRTAPTAALIKTLNGKNVTTKAITSTVAQPVFTGTAEAGSTVAVAFSDTLSYKAAVAADGSWTLTPSAVVANGKYTLTVTSADVAGNATAASYTLTQAAK